MGKTKEKVVKRRPIINVILDRSGSMSVMKDATIEMFNEYLEGNRDSRWTLTQFDSGYDGVECDTMYVARKGEKVPRLNPDTYQPRGMTPLYDAIGVTLRKLDDYLKGQNGNARKVVVVIITDGQENASVEFSQNAIKRLVKEREDMGWQFMYLASGLNAEYESQLIGVTRGQTISYDPQSVPQATQAVATATNSYYSAAAGQTISGHMDVTDKPSKAKSKSKKR